MKDGIFCGMVNFMNMELEYYIIPEDISPDNCTLRSYGIRVVKTERSEGGGSVVESKEINNVFYHRSDAQKFVDLIKRNCVTPMALMDVVEDYIVDYFLV